MAIFKSKTKTISFTETEKIKKSIEKNNHLEITDCKDKMAVAIFSVEQIIRSFGMTFIVEHSENRSTNNAQEFDYKIIHNKNTGTLTILKKEEQNIFSNVISQKYQTAKNAAGKTWDEHAPSKEAVIGSALLGIPGHLILGTDGVQNVGTKVLNRFSSTKAEPKISTPSTAKTTAADSPLASENSTNSIEVGDAENVFKLNGLTIFGGALVGVAAVAAAPFTGGGSVLGAATLIGSLSGATGAAALAGGTGAAAGVAIQNKRTAISSATATFFTTISNEASKMGTAVNHVVSRTSLKKLFQEGREFGMAESAAKIKDLENRLIKAAHVYEEQNKTNEYVVCLFAVGAAIAACDGSLNKDEEIDLKEFILGASAEQLPDSLKEPINRLIKNPPNFSESIKYIERLDRKIWPIIDDVLTIVSEADNEISSEECEFIEKWNDYKISNSSH